MASRQEFDWVGLHNSLDESKVPVGRFWSSQNGTVSRGVLEGGPRYGVFGSRSGAAVGDVGWGGGFGSYRQSEIQTLTGGGTWSGGDFTLGFEGTVANPIATQPTGAIAYSDGDTDGARDALEALAGIKPGDIVVTGGPMPSSPLRVAWTGQYSGVDMKPLVVTNNVTGVAPTLEIATLTNGGEESVYLTAVQHSGDSTVTMYKVDASTGTYTSIATGLDASDWLFLQYGDRIFAWNAVDGSHFYRFGGSWDDGGSGARPRPPSYAGSYSFDFTGDVLNFSASGTGALSATYVVDNLTEATAHNETTVTITNSGLAITTPTKITIHATLGAAQDWSFNDVWRLMVNSASSADVSFALGTLKLWLVNNDGSPVTLDPLASWEPQASQGATQLETFFHFMNDRRTSRDNVIKVELSFTVNLWGATKSITFSVFKGLSWMSDLIPVEFSGEVNQPDSFTRKATLYAMAYSDTSSGLESDLRNIRPIPTPPFPVNWQGSNVVFTLPGSSDLTTDDRIFVYRKEALTGEWRRLPVSANALGTYGAANVASGTTTFTDKWMEGELGEFPVPGQPPFGGLAEAASAPIGTEWKQSLVMGWDRKLWESWVGQPDAFAPDPDDRAATRAFAEENADIPDAGKTVYMSDNRSEAVLCVAGQDSLYAAGPYSTYAVVGDSPQASSPPRRLPGSRGVLSQRAMARFFGGVQAMSEDGLWFYAVGRGFSGEDNGALVKREETREVRRSYETTLLGSEGSSALVWEFEDETWMAVGERYLRRTRDERWEEGTYAVGIVAAMPVRSFGNRVVDARGRVLTLSEAYATDDGEDVSWEFVSGVMNSPAIRVTGFEVFCEGTPRIELRVYGRHGKETDTAGRHDRYRFDPEWAGQHVWSPVVVDPGYRHRFVFSGVCGRDKLVDLAVLYEGMGKVYR